MEHTNSLFTFNTDKESIITDFKFIRDTGVFRTHLFHEELANQIADKKQKTASVIIVEDMLKEELYDDPINMHKTNHVMLGNIESEVMRRSMNISRHIDEILKDKYGVTREDSPKDNYSEGKEKESLDNEHYWKLFDSVCQAYLRSDSLDFIDRERNECGYDYDEEKDIEIPLSKEEADERWEKKKLEMFLPKVEATYERQYLMPKPFDFWDRRNLHQQWFFIDDLELPNLSYAWGGGGGSYTREQQGRYSHTFAYLAEYHNIETPTYLFRYTSDSKFKLEKYYPTFKAIGHDISGNYPSDHEITKKLFKGRRLFTSNKLDENNIILEGE